MSDKLDTGHTTGDPAPAAEPTSVAAGQSDRPRQPSAVSIVPILRDFADSVSGLIFDGQTLRIELRRRHLDEVRANTPLTGRRYPAGRIVLPPTAAVDLINRMQQIAAGFRQAGVVKAASPRREAG